VFEGFDSLNTDNINDQMESISGGLQDAFAFEVKESGVLKRNTLAATIHAGIEARMPFYERLAFGALYTQQIEGKYSWSEGRLAMSLAPARWFALSANYALSHFGHSWGGAVNIHLPGFGIFAGVDSFAPFLNMTPQYVPVNPLNTNFALGLNLTFGKYNGRYPKEK
jgi:hypothetical protein